MTMNYHMLYRQCRLCPRACGVDRAEGADQEKKGFCREGVQLKVSFVGPHFGEEPPISGKNGSGTIFFSGCSLQCSFCQNYQISKGHVGEYTTVAKLYERVRKNCLENGVHNINLVTPDHFFPHIVELVLRMRKGNLNVPVLYNLSGYQSIEMLKMAEPYVDIYLPDFKYSDPHLAERLSKVKDYPEKALEAIVEMVRQKGFLRIAEGEDVLADRGVLVRHLILPGNVENSLNAISCLFLEFGKDLPLSIMSQYHPVHAHEDLDFNRKISEEEFKAVYAHARDLGFHHLYVQFPGADRYRDAKEGVSPFLPDFRKRKPFGESLKSQLFS